MRICRSDRPPGRAVWHHEQRAGADIRAGDLVLMPSWIGSGTLWLAAWAEGGRCEIVPWGKTFLNETTLSELWKNEGGRENERDDREASADA